METGQKPLDLEHNLLFVPLPVLDSRLEELKMLLPFQLIAPEEVEVEEVEDYDCIFNTDIYNILWNYISIDFLKHYR